MYFVIKTESFAKLFFLISFTGLLMYAVLAFYTFHTAYSSMSSLQKYRDTLQGLPEYIRKIEKNKKILRNILLWATDDPTQAMFLSEGQSYFIDNNCKCKNCYLTADKYFMGDNYSNFDAIVFDISLLKTWKKKNFPEMRSAKQKYIFFSKESSDEAPICNIFADNYFNWTWSYKLDSDIVSSFFEVRDNVGNVVAPKLSVDWMSNMTELPEKELSQLKYKKKAMAWVSTRCMTRNNRMALAKRLQAVFKEENLVFDIYGCGFMECPKEGCSNVIKRDYYFYFAAEASTAEDYVTDEVLVAFNNYAVPIVLGGANYRRFLPEGSYINAFSTSIDKLVAFIGYIIRNPKIYYSFHRWRQHYTINEVEEFKGICEVCEYLNDEGKFGTVSVRKDFRKWWHPSPLFERCFPKGAENLSEVLSYVNKSRRSLR